jgi:hypothetical protein
MTNKELKYSQLQNHHLDYKLHRGVAAAPRNLEATSGAARQQQKNRHRTEANQAESKRGSEKVPAAAHRGCLGVEEGVQKWITAPRIQIRVQDTGVGWLW